MDVRAELWTDSSLERVRQCGRVSVLPGGDVVARGSRRPDSSTVAGFAGLSTCGSVWCCPVCAAKIAYGRADDLGRVLGWCNGCGNTVVLTTLTMRHRLGQPLKECWDAATTAWGRVTSGGRWGKIKDRYDVLGWNRVVEVTYGLHGWHCHLHVVAVLSGPMSLEMVRPLGDAIWVNWAKGLASKGFDALRDSGGLDIRVVNDATELAGYLIKQAALEVTHGHAKQGRQHGRTPFEIYADFRATGDMADLALWREWEQTSRGRKQMTWSQGFREMVGLAEEEASDDELAAEEVGAGEDLVQLPAATWRVIRPKSWELLDVIEVEGLVGAERWLRARGLAYGVISVRGVVPP